jgi:hypothetical protein
MITASQPCAWCSVLFRPLRPTHRFCSNPCRKRCLAEEMRGRHRRPDEASRRDGKCGSSGHKRCCSGSSGC